jgi:hypothetical protein
MNTYSINCVDGKNVLIRLSDDADDDAIANVLQMIHSKFGIEPEDALNCAVSHLTSANLTFEICPHNLLNMMLAFWSGCCVAQLHPNDQAHQA